MQIVNARLRQRPELYRIEISNGLFTDITAQDSPQTATAEQLDAGGKLICAPFIEPHIHLDAALTAGEPSWNQSGTLFEGIERWLSHGAFRTAASRGRHSRTRVKNLKPTHR